MAKKKQNVRDEILAEARSWLGTPFHHQGRLLGVGVDCVGVVIGVGKTLGFINFDTTSYARSPNADEMRKVLRQHMVEILIKDAKPGDVLLFAFDREPQHVGFLTDTGLLHAYAQVRKCVEHSYDATWQSRVRGAYRFKGVE